MLRVRPVVLAALLCALSATPALAAPGDLDLTFSGDGKAERQLDSTGAGARDVAVDATNRTVAAGSSGSGSAERPAVVRFTAQGGTDTTFGAEETAGGPRIGARVFSDRSRQGRWEAVAVQPSTGRIILAGWELDQQGRKQLLIAGLNAEGDLDHGFGGALSGGYIVEQWGTETAAQDVTVQADGRIVVAAEVDGDKAVVARYSADGVIDDPGFGVSGRVTLTPSVGTRTLATRAVLVDPVNGAIYVGGGEHQTIDNAYYRISRLTSAGAVDPTWGTPGSENGHWIYRLGTNGGFTNIEALGREADGTIAALAGHSPFGPVGWALIDFTSPTGGSPAINQGTSMNPQGLVVSGNHAYGVGGFNQNAIVLRWDLANAAALDPAFGGGDGQVAVDFGGADVAYGAALDHNHGLVVAGRGAPAPDRFVAARIKTIPDPPASTPVSQSPPEVSPTTNPVAVGTTLTKTSDGTWSGATPITFAYRWQRCDAGPANCLYIKTDGSTTNDPEAAGVVTGTSYVTSGTDVGKHVRLKVFASNAAGAGAPAASSTREIVQAAASGAPQLQQAPTISPGGVVTPGQILSGTTGVWNPEPSEIRLRWQRCESADAQTCPFIKTDGTTADSIDAPDLEWQTTYRARPQDVGRFVRVYVAVAGSGGSNAAWSPARLVEADTAAPAPAFTAPGDDHHFKDDRPTFTGTRGMAGGDEPFVYVHIYEWTGSEWKRRADLQAEATNTGGANWSYQVPAKISEGTYDIEILQLDASGNEGKARRRFRVDRTAPRVSFTSPAYDQTLRTARPVFTGKAGTEGGDRDILTGRIWQWNGQGWVRFVSNHTFVRSGENWAWTSPVDLPPGTYDLEVEQADLADNVAAPRQRFQIDTPRLATNDGNFYLGGVAEVENQVSMGWDKPWNASPDTQFFYVWQRCTSTDPGSCKRTDDGGPTRTYTDTYIVEPADRNHRLRGVVIAVNDAGWTVKTTPMSAVVPKATRPPSGGTPRITGTAEVFGRLQIDPGRWSGDKPIRTSAEWHRCWVFLFYENCQYTGRVGDTYPLDKGDLGYRFKARVVATNDAGSASQWTTQTAAVDHDRYTRRHQIVGSAFRATLGREPSASEMKKWVDREDSFASIVRALQGEIRASKRTAESVVEAAYKKVYGHEHYSYSQKEQFAADVKAEQTSGATFDDLVTQYAEALVKQAHEKIFFFAPASSKWRKPSKATVERFVDRVRGGEYNRSVKQHGTAGEQLWTQVALSNPTVHGAARVAYPIAGDDTSTGDPKAARREGCFGGIGPGCKGAPLTHAPEVPSAGAYKKFTSLDGRVMSYIRLSTAIGSILHDAECRTHVYGAWCAQDGWNQLASEGLGILSKAVMPASAEWDKATTNTLTGRIWDEIYGPYPASDAEKLIAGKAGEDITYSDDLRFSSGGRKAKISLGSLHVLGVSSIVTLPLALVKAPYFDWKGREVAATTRLAAPAGTKLDIWDADFCKSKEFTGFVIVDGECK